MNKEEIKNKISELHKELDRWRLVHKISPNHLLEKKISLISDYILNFHQRLKEVEFAEDMSKRIPEDPKPKRVRKKSLDK